MPSGFYLALHVDVFTAGHYIPGPVIKLKGFGVVALSCVTVEGISLRGLTTCHHGLDPFPLPAQVRDSCTVRPVLVTALGGFCLESWRRGTLGLKGVL